MLVFRRAYICIYIYKYAFTFPETCFPLCNQFLISKMFLIDLKKTLDVMPQKKKANTFFPEQNPVKLHRSMREKNVAPSDTNLRSITAGKRSRQLSGKKPPVCQRKKRNGNRMCGIDFFLLAGEKPLYKEISMTLPKKLTANALENGGIPKRKNLSSNNRQEFRGDKWPSFGRRYAVNKLDKIGSMGSPKSRGEKCTKSLLNRHLRPRFFLA